MTIRDLDQLIDALGNNASRMVINKTTLANAVVGQYFSTWLGTGVPGAGAVPGAAAICVNGLPGGFGFTNQISPVTSYLAWLSFQSTTMATNLEIHDRLIHMGGLSGTVITAQGALSLVTTDPGAARVGDANLSDVQWWLEVYAQLGVTAVNATVNVTYSDATSANLPVISLGADPRPGRLYPVISASPGLSIRSVNSVTLSASTGTAGNFGITATRSRALVSANITHKTEIWNWADLGLPEIANDSCLMMLQIASTALVTGIRGQGKIAHG